jgi:hypothetical protein
MKLKFISFNHKTRENMMDEACDDDDTDDNIFGNPAKVQMI